MCYACICLSVTSVTFALLPESANPPETGFSVPERPMPTMKIEIFFPSEPDTNLLIITDDAARQSIHHTPRFITVKRGSFLLNYTFIVSRERRNELRITDSDESAMAPAAIIGFKSPNAARGIAATL